MNVAFRDALAFAPDGSRFAVGHSGGRVAELRNGRPGARRQLGRGLGGDIYEERGPEEILVVAFSPDGRWLATLDSPGRAPWDLGSRDTLVRLFDTRTWTLAACYGVDDGATALCWKDDGRSAWIGYADGALREVLLVSK